MSDNPAYTRIGNAFLDALAVRDFERIGKLLHPEIRFRGLVQQDGDRYVIGRPRKEK